MFAPTGRKVMFLLGLCLLTAATTLAESDSNRRSYSKFLVYGSPHMSSYRHNQYAIQPDDNDDNNNKEIKYKRETNPINFYWQAMMSRMGKHNVDRVLR